MAQIAEFFIKITLVTTVANAVAYIPYPYYTLQPGQSTYPAGAMTPAITSVSSNIYRTPGNFGQISTYHKSIDTPFSKVRKQDVRISNDIVTPFAATYHVASPLQIPATPAHGAVHTAPVAITYSAAPAVTHLTFDGFGTHYAW